MTRSQYADRDTVGTMALKARQVNDNPCAGDLGHELMPSLVEDLNKAIASNPFNGRKFFITIHEKKDAQLTNTILRRMIVSEQRPYPEPNTAVFVTDPQKQETRFCWSLPHQTLFFKVLLEPDRYGAEQVGDVKAYQAEKLEHFGFKRTRKSNIYIPNPKFEDRPLKRRKETKSSIILL